MILTNLYFPLPNDALCQVLLKLANWFGRESQIHVGETFTTTTPIEHGQILQKKLICAFGWCDLQDKLCPI